MLSVFVYGIPEKTSEDLLSAVRARLMDAIFSFSQFNYLKDGDLEKNISFFFPKDMLRSNLRNGITIIVKGNFPGNIEERKDLEWRIATRLESILTSFFLDFKRECFVDLKWP